MSASRRAEGTTLTVDCGEGFAWKGALLAGFSIAVAAAAPGMSTLWWAALIVPGTLAYLSALLRKLCAFVFDARSGRITTRYCLSRRGGTSHFADWAIVRTRLVRSDEPKILLELCSADGKTLPLASARPLVDNSQRGLSWARFRERDDMLDLRARIAVLASLCDGGYVPSGGEWN